MKLAIAALLVASAAAFAPVAPVFTRTTSLGYSIHVINEDEGIDTTFDCAGDVFIVGELLFPVGYLSAVVIELYIFGNLCK
jgi:hypothetical protein